MEARPDYGWLSEETDDNPERLNNSTVFVVDPIDGTRSFVAGEKIWAHSIAIVRDGEPIAGVVGLPAIEREYSARPGRASVNGEVLAPKRRLGLQGSEVLAPRSVTNPENWASKSPDFSRHFRPSLAYRMCLVAEGKFDAMITLRAAWEWDIAAGSLIAEAAGAVTSNRSGQRLRFNNQTPLLDGVLAAGSDIHQEVVANLAPGTSL